MVRLASPATVLPGNMTLGASRDPALARRAGVDVGRSLERLGFNMDPAPVLDINSNPSNPVIGVRSFGEDPRLVAELGPTTSSDSRARGWWRWPSTSPATATPPPTPTTACPPSPTASSA